jgi:hypothetical protein
VIPASQRLYDAVVECRLVHPDVPRLNAHIAAAVAKHSRRGWRIDRADEPVDGAIALAMLVDRIAHAAAAEPVRLLGWL